MERIDQGSNSDKDSNNKDDSSEENTGYAEEEEEEEKNYVSYVAAILLSMNKLAKDYLQVNLMLKVKQYTPTVPPDQPVAGGGVSGPHFWNTNL